MPRQPAIHTADFIRVNVLAEFRLEASSNRLGILWWFLEPLMMMAIFYVVFGLILERGGKDFVYYLLVGITTWLWFAATVTRTMNSIPRAGNLIQQIYIPKTLLPCVAITTELLKAGIILGFLLILLAVLNGVSLTWLYFPVVLLVQLLFAAGCGVVVAALTPFFNDITFVVQLGLRAAMFLSGVFFIIDETIPAPWADILLLNPMAILITEFRHVLVDATAPNWFELGWISVLSLLLLILGFGMIRRFDRDYPRFLL